MSVGSNPDRIYVPRQFRAKIRLDHDVSTQPQTSVHNVSLPGMGAALMDISASGCCLRISRGDFPFSSSPERHISSIKLLHPDLESTPIGGRIAWYRDDPPFILIGIQFTHIRPMTLESIHSYVEAHRSMSV